MINTREGRTLLENLIAARIDLSLQVKIEPSLKADNSEVNHNQINLYPSTERDDGDVVTHWTICRAFLRELHLQRRFDNDPKRIRQVFERFSEIMEPYMCTRKREAENVLRSASHCTRA